ncbi:hypothetical protein KJ632_04820 [Patescibacteria group bacterium]|nr:hypothetical protein [Patescibacteria group bacterium]
MFFRKFFAGALIAFFIFLSLPAAFIWASAKTLSDEEFYTEQLSDSLYSILIEEGQNFYADFKVLDIPESKFRDILMRTIQRDDLRGAIAVNIENLKSVEFDAEGKAKLVINLSIFDEKFDKFADQISRFWFETLSECDNTKPVYKGDFICIPEGFDGDDYRMFVASELDKQIFSDFPSEVVREIDVSETFLKNRGNVLEFFGYLLNQFYLVVSLILLLLLLLIGLLIFKPAIRVFKWVMKTLALASAFVLALSFSISYIIPTIVQKFFEGINLVLYNVFAHSLTVNLLQLAIPVFVIGFGFWIVGIIFDENEDIAY